MDRFDNVDAVGQAALVRGKALSAVELVEFAIARIEALNPALNAVIWPLFDEALDTARSAAVPGGPLGGVPFLMKDIGAVQGGSHTRWGTRRCATPVTALRTIPSSAPASEPRV